MSADAACRIGVPPRACSRCWWLRVRAQSRRSCAAARRWHGRPRGRPGRCSCDAPFDWVLVWSSTGSSAKSPSFKSKKSATPANGEGLTLWATAHGEAERRTVQPRGENAAPAAPQSAGHPPPPATGRSGRQSKRRQRRCELSVVTARRGEGLAAAISRSGRVRAEARNDGRSVYRATMRPEPV